MALTAEQIAERMIYWQGVYDDAAAGIAETQPEINELENRLAILNKRLPVYEETHRKAGEILRCLKIDQKKLEGK